MYLYSVHNTSKYKDDKLGFLLSLKFNTETDTIYNLTGR